jgi:hypothetical protein
VGASAVASGIPEKPSPCEWWHATARTVSVLRDPLSLRCSHFRRTLSPSPAIQGFTPNREGQQGCRCIACFARENRFARKHADPASAHQGRNRYVEAAELAESQGALMLNVRTATSEARLDIQLGALDQASRRVQLALSAIPEDDGSWDLVEARRLTSR